MGGSDQKAESGRPNRTKLIVTLAAVGVFLIAFIGVSVWLIASFLKSDQTKVIVLSDDAAKEVRVLPQAVLPKPAATPANLPVFNGKVVDAATKQPIPDFTVRVGYGFTTSNQLPQYSGPARQFKDGQYTKVPASASGGTNMQYYVRIEAHGYMPAVSAGLDPTSATQDFELTAGQDLRGHVLTADGAPVAGATVTVALPGSATTVGLNGGNVPAANRGYTQSVTGADGTYDLPPQTDNYALAVESDQGYAEVAADALAKSTDIRVAAWGRIQGVFLLGTKPGAKERISAQSGMAGTSPDQPRINMNLTATTGDDGSFTIDRVPPDSMQIYRMVISKVGRQIGTGELLQTTNVAPGETVTLKLGGEGRPVSGKLIFSTKPTGQNFYVSGTAAQGMGAGARRYSLDIQKDFTFRIENVVPGDYTININYQPNSGRVPPQTRASFTMPDVPDGVSDEALAIDDIKVNTTAATGNNGQLNAASSPTFSGTVVDAATKQPVPSFTVRIGYGNGAANSQPPQFNQAARTFTGGQYKMAGAVNGNVPAWFVRVEAHGYAPMVSPPLTSGKPKYDFELTPAPDIQGHVFEPDGTAAAGARVMVALAGSYVNINPGNLQFGTVATGGSDGAYDLMPQSGRYDLVVLSKLGYARVSQDAVAASADIHLAAWSRVNGQFWVGTKLGAGRVITINTADGQAFSPGEPRVFMSLEGTTDGQGKFTIDNVPPGAVQVGDVVQQDAGVNQLNMVGDIVDVNAPAGGTLTLKLGGVGRPVVGNIIFPPGIKGAANYYLNANATGTPAIVPPPQMPDNVKNGNPLARQTWMKIFALTAAGKEYLAAHPEAIVAERRLAMATTADHKFRIDNVPPGDYQISINLQVLGNTGGNSIRQGQAAFTMPDVPGGVSDEPLVIPDIKISGN